MSGTVRECTYLPVVCKTKVLQRSGPGQVCTPEILVDKVSKSTIVAIDTSGHHAEAANEAGIAILPIFPSAFSTYLRNMSALSRSTAPASTIFVTQLYLPRADTPST